MNTKQHELKQLIIANDRRADAERQMRHYVGTAVEQGASWAEIGAALGISKQTAHARYGKTTVSPGETPSKISDADVAGTSETPSIFSDTPAPAKPKKAGYNGPFMALNRKYGRIIEEPYEGMARPGTGKGKHRCEGCGHNNHHGSERGHILWNDGCKPTKYDTAEEAEFLNNWTKENTK